MGVDGGRPIKGRRPGAGSARRWAMNRDRHFPTVAAAIRSRRATSLFITPRRTPARSAPATAGLRMAR